MTAPHLLIENVRKSFGPKDVLNGVSLSVARGELLAILGPSGCGKSTLLRVVSGLLPQDRGRVSIGGRDMGQAPQKDGKYDHHHEGLQDSPGGPQRRLFVTHFDIAPNQEVEQLAIFPDLLEIQQPHSARGLDVRDGPLRKLKRAWLSS